MLAFGKESSDSFIQWYNALLFRVDEENGDGVCVCVLSLTYRVSQSVKEKRKFGRKVPAR